MEYCHFSLVELLAMLEEGRVTAQELTEYYLERVEKDQLNTYLRVNPEAIRRAWQADRRRKEGDGGRLLGIPWAAKDNLLTRGLATTAASNALAEMIPPWSARSVERLEDEGAILLGKTNLDEFSMGASGETSAFGPVGNPWDPSRVPGGSSSGSAAALAAGLCAFALGSDTGGSVRQPAAYTGLVGLRPTPGRISRYGMIAFAPALDQVGILTRTPQDMALVLYVLSGYDEKDPGTVQRKYGELQTEGGVAGMRVGVAAGLARQSMPGVAAVVEQAASELSRQGARVSACALPDGFQAMRVYQALSRAEAYRHLAQDGVCGYGVRLCEPGEEGRCLPLSGLGKEARRRVAEGERLLSPEGRRELSRACEEREQIALAHLRLLAEYDMILTPSAPTGAFALGETDTFAVQAADLFAVGASLAGLPALSVPAGMTEGLPVGVQLIGRPFQEQDMLRAAQALYQRLWERRMTP